MTGFNGLHLTIIGGLIAVALLILSLIEERQYTALARRRRQRRRLKARAELLENYRRDLEHRAEEKGAE